MSNYSTMDTYIAEFAAQIGQAVAIGEKAELSSPEHEIRNIVVSGLGGSGIGGSFMGALLANELQVPLAANNDYFLPGYVNQHTLLLICSYSGNTEETVEAIATGIEKGAKIVCITSGGKILDAAKEHGFDFIQIPGGMPPRACLNLSFIQQAFVFQKLGLISTQLIDQIKASEAFLNAHDAEIKAAGQQLAKDLDGKIPVIYGENRMQAIAVRFRQQINENGKMLAWHHVIPEMNHNELVGWKNVNGKLGVVFLHNDDDYYRNVRRMEIVAEVAGKYADVYHIHSKGSNFLEKALYHIYLTDWATFYLAELNGSDAVEVNVIDYLKGELKKI